MSTIRNFYLKTYDMTRESAFCKLMFLLSNIKEKDVIKQLLDINFRGEIIKNNGANF